MNMLTKGSFVKAVASSRRPKWAIVALCLVWSAQALGFPDGMTGRDFLKLRPGQQQDFASAAYWGVMGAVSHGGKNSNFGWLLGCTEDWEPDQLAAALTNWFMARPNGWDRNAGSVMLYALAAACPNAPKGLKDEAKAP